MNASGKSVAASLRGLKLDASALLVVHDEIDFDFGRLQLRHDGGHGGHNGLRDAITHCGAEFWRLRLGVGHPGDKSQVIDYVLQRARPAEENAIVDAIDAGLDSLTVLLRDGAEKAMSRLHTKAISE